MAFKWTAQATIATALSTELNALANNTLSALSAEVDNSLSANRNIYADYQLDVTYGTAPSAGGGVRLLIVPALDGTNYATNNQDYSPNWAGSFPLRAVTTQQIIVLRAILLPATKFKVALYNEAGQAMPASGTTLKYRTYNTENV